MVEAEVAAVLTTTGLGESVGGEGVGVHCSGEDTARVGVPDGLADDLEKGLRVWTTGSVGSGGNKALGVPLSPPSRPRTSLLRSAGRARAGRAKARPERTSMSVEEQGRDSSSRDSDPSDSSQRGFRGSGQGIR